MCAPTFTHTADFPNAVKPVRRPLSPRDRHNQPIFRYVRGVHDVQTLSSIDNADSCSFEPTKQHRCLDRPSPGCHLRKRDHARASTELPHASSDEPAITLSSDLTRTIITRTDRQPRPSPLEPPLARSMTAPRISRTLLPGAPTTSGPTDPVQRAQQDARQHQRQPTIYAIARHQWSSSSCRSSTSRYSAAQATEHNPSYSSPARRCRHTSHRRTRSAGNRAIPNAALTTIRTAAAQTNTTATLDSRNRTATTAHARADKATAAGAW